MIISYFAIGFITALFLNGMFTKLLLEEGSISIKSHINQLTAGVYITSMLFWWVYLLIMLWDIAFGHFDYFAWPKWRIVWLRDQ